MKILIIILGLLFLTGIVQNLIWPPKIMELGPEEDFIGFYAGTMPTGTQNNFIGDHGSNYYKVPAGFGETKR